MAQNRSVVVLAGGTGGAKLARGMLDVVGPERLTVVANTGDDIEIYGGYVSPDPDLVTFWLTDRIDARGWGLDGDSFSVMEALRALGEEIWFNLGDQDLAIAIRRAAALRDGLRLTEAQASICTHLVPPSVSRAGTERGSRRCPGEDAGRGNTELYCPDRGRGQVPPDATRMPQDSRTGVLTPLGQVLPMSDQPVRTRVLADGRWWGLQEFLIKAGGRGEVQDVQFRGARAAGTTPEVFAAIAAAEVIVIGPSNPVISIGPMLAIGELRAALIASPAPVVAVSPIVGGEVLKGPTASFMRHRGVELSAAGLAALYDGLIDALVTDEPGQPGEPPLPALRTDLRMGDAESRRRLAHATLEFARSVTPRHALPSSFSAG